MAFHMLCPHCQMKLKAKLSAGWEPVPADEETDLNVLQTARRSGGVTPGGQID